MKFFRKSKSAQSYIKTSSLFLIMLFCLMTFLGGCSSAGTEPPGAAVATTIKVGGIISLTGPDSNIGSQIQIGYEFAVEDINKAGGIFVKEYNKKIPLELKILDMESSAEKAIARAETLYSKENVVAYIGTTYIGAASGIAEKNKVPTILVASAAQSSHERGYKYWFSLSDKAPDIAKAAFDVLDMIPQNSRPNSIAIFEEQTDFGIEQSRYFREEAEKRGYKVAAVEKYNMMAKDFSPLILSAKAAKAEALLGCPITPDGIAMVRQMKELDYNPKFMLLERASTDLSWTQAMGELGDYVVSVPGWHPDLTFPGVAELDSRYVARYSQPTGPFVGQAYATIQVLADAIGRAGSLDREKIREALAATDLMTVQGPVKFRPNGTNVTPHAASTQWQKGQNMLIWPVSAPAVPLLYPIPPWKDR